MPFTRIDLMTGKSTNFRATISEVVYEAMRNVLDVPEGDRFQVITEHTAENFVFDSRYLAVARTADSIFIQVTLDTGRTVDMKRTFYLEVVDKLNQRLKLRREDVFINSIEVSKENWSFGNGIAQYAP